ncbi:receptor like protein 30-like isoform X4 [Prunus avium]|uniref:Receptor like protein 30-like isoform X4 n=1 Tax=Prunus avium TaxID=42229 RepID=A0A6P5R5B6_PRUAV|nr:receptor like protein 30-like isoform X4 [Prunus avium]
MTLTNMVGVRCFFKLLYAIVVLILLHMNNPCIGCSERESQALLALKQGLVADDGGPSLSWGREAQNKDCCGWDGVHCSDQTGHVVKLDLQDQYLQGTFEMTCFPSVEDGCDEGLLFVLVFEYLSDDKGSH